jgi:inorganic phosphate transporter, PiT family
MELKNIADLQKATKRGQKEVFRLGVGLLFVLAIMLYTNLSLEVSGTQGSILILASMIAGYMAMNIGANDVANNVAPAVGSKSLTMTGAIIIAAIFEMMGALIAGGDVVSTIRGNIIDPKLIGDGNRFIWVMTSALLAGALWLNFATVVGAPVSTTHSIVGAVLGAGLAAGGFGVVNWPVMGGIALSWVVSPLLGGLVAAGFLYWIKRAITYQPNMINAAKRTVPILIGIMSFAFTTYLILKGLNKIWKLEFMEASLVGLGIGLLTWLVVRPMVSRRAKTISPNKAGINTLFTVPLIFSAALLSFAHGANDVANAIGPLAAIVDTVLQGDVSSKAGIPLWVMIVGAVGIAIGLSLYGPKLIRTVGGEITELDQMRAFCIAMAASLTVIIASQLGLPVSSTHIAIGGIFGVGFLRERLKSQYSRMIEEIRFHHLGEDQQQVEEFLIKFTKVDMATKKAMLKQLKVHAAEVILTKKERKKMKRVYREELVKRSAFFKIIAAWVITVPASAMLAGGIFYLISLAASK